MSTLQDLRIDFERRSRRSMSMPIAGTIVWSVAGVAGLFLPLKSGVTVLVLAMALIFPLALAVASVRGEELTGRDNPLSRLMGACVVMVNLLWALHIPLYFAMPRFVPLSLGIALGLHWVVYSWIVAHPLGYRHAIVRTLGLLAAWWLFPEWPVTACAAVVVAAYALTLVEMARRPVPALAQPAQIASEPA
ncbi:hypothetical protein JI752_001120 [Lysobacter sp. MMG2]|uniref:DUF7010 family protein n=1 Tax=Lysobacter sp. MMG2 TaxID=2801338 RepID=UPI001C238B88|nr:hypothetical protein [Lysobacter sp. MMG2]MBU8974732.1 hypothetical protein [Lysobacter sp. MMG2]